MVLQVSADAWQIDATTSMPCARSSSAGPTPDSMQELRRVDGAAAQDHLARAPAAVSERPAADVVDADGAPALEADATGRARW